MRSARSLLHRIADRLRGKPRGGLAVWGWWQGRNLGDNWIKECMARMFPGACFIDSYSRNFADFGFVICGGGGLFVRGAHPAWLTGDIPVPYGMIGLGAEFPHKDTRARELAAKARFFFVRDAYSATCMNLPAESRSYDVTFSSPLPWHEKLTPGRALLVWREPDELLAHGDFRSYIGSVQPRQEWAGILRHVCSRVVEDDFHKDAKWLTELTQDIEVVVSARYHGLVAAIQRGIPCIAIDLCPKSRQIMLECDLEEYCIKIGEAARCAELVAKARAEAAAVREKQARFLRTAKDKLAQDIQFARAAVDEVLGGEQVG